MKDGCDSPPKWWHLFCERLHVRGNGLTGKFSLKVFPDSDIRHLITAHRQIWGATLE